MAESDVVALRMLGFSDVEINIATQMIAHFNYINCIAGGLIVDPENWMTLDPDEWRERTAQATDYL